MTRDLYHEDFNFYHENQILYHTGFHTGFPLLSIFSALCSTNLLYRGMCIMARDL